MTRSFEDRVFCFAALVDFSAKHQEKTGDQGLSTPTFKSEKGEDAGSNFCFGLFEKEAVKIAEQVKLNNRKSN